MSTAPYPSTFQDNYTAPKLKPDGSNWPSWFSTTEAYFGARGVKRHAQGTARKPPKPAAYDEKKTY